MAKANHAKGFVDFVREQGVVGLAVGLAIGAAAGEAVKQIVEGLINPIIGYLVGGVSLDKQMWHTGLFRGSKELIFSWGAVISAVIVLLATTFVVYQIVHIAKLDRLDKKKD